MDEHKIHSLGLVRPSSSTSLTHKTFSFVLQPMYLLRWMQGPRTLSAHHLSSIVFHGHWKDGAQWVQGMACLSLWGVLLNLGNCK